ncbi:MAG: ROK family transcriptional regulator, partial [Chloroflexota bacterium]
MTPTDPAATDRSRPRTGPARPALLRTINDEVALRLLLERGPSSRSDVVRLTGVSKPTGSQMFARLELAGLVRPVGVTRGKPGRTALLYEINPDAGLAAAIDVTPVNIHAQVANLAGAVIGEHELARPSRTAGSGPANALDTLDRALEAAGRRRSEVTCLVVAATGSYDAAADLLRYARHLHGWHNAGLVRALQPADGVPVVIENDVNLAAVAERRAGAARDLADFFLFWVGDGIGGALMLEDRLRRGATGGAGEVAFLQPPGAAVVHNPARGGSGGLQRWTDGSELADLARAHGLRGKDAAALVAAAVASGAPSSGQFLDALALRYALGLSAVIAVLDPGAIVLAGPVLAAGGEQLRGRIGRHLDDLAVASPRLVCGTVQG